MKFITVNNTIINTNYIVEIFIDKKKDDDSYDIVIFYEGFNVLDSDKTKQVLYYKKNMKNYETALKTLKELFKKLNS